ncbi:hypothetical protein HG530_015439 [Fusarium avenaceum]|nr:hypothetical protein HG530_015439 [Fusarium avenaceum]
MQLLENSKDSTARSGNDTVLLCNLLNLRHDTFGVIHLARNFTSLCLESLECLNDVVIIKNVATRLVEGLQQPLLQLPQMDFELSLQLDELNENTATGLLIFLVENVVEDRIQVFSVLDEDGVSKSQRTLKLLGEGVIQETRHCQAAILALSLQELRDSSRGVDDEGVTIEALENNRVLGAQVVDWESVDAGLQLRDVVLHGLCISLRLKCLFLQIVHLDLKGTNTVEDIEDAGNKVVFSYNTLDGLPVVDLVAEQGTDSIHSKSDTLRWITHGPDFGQVLTLDVADTGFCFLNRRFGLGEVLQYNLLSRSHLHFLLIQSSLYLQRSTLPLLCFTLIGHHALQLLVRLHILLLQLLFLLRQAHSKISDLVNGVSQFLQTHIQMALLLFKIFSLLIVKLDILSNEIEEVARGQESNLALLLEQFLVVSLIGTFEVTSVQVDRMSQFMANLEECLIRPVTKPVENTTIEQSGTSCGLGREAILRRVHGKDHVQVLDDLLREPLVQLFGGVKVQVLSLGTLLTCCHESSILVTLEKTRDLSVGEQCVHSLKEA